MTPGVVAPGLRRPRRCGPGPAPRDPGGRGRRPHERLVGRLQPGQAGLVHDLRHRAGLGHRPLERPPVGRQHRPDHRARLRPGGHDLRDQARDDPAPAMTARADHGEPAEIETAADEQRARRPAMISSATQDDPVPLHLARRPAEPALGRRRALSSAGVELALDLRAELQQLGVLRAAPSRRPTGRAARGALRHVPPPRPSGRRAFSRRRAAPPLRAVCRGSGCRPFATSSDLVLLEGQLAPAGEVEQGGGEVRAASSSRRRRGRRSRRSGPREEPAVSTDGSSM